MTTLSPHFRPRQAKARVGFIGAGNFISAHHLPNAAQSASTVVQAVCDLSESRRDQHQKAYPDARICSDYREILADPAVDIVVIGTKHDLHARFIIEALQAEKWVFCEKPMAENDEETNAVLAAERQAEGRLGIGFNRRFAPAYARAKRLLHTQKPPYFINYRLMWPTPLDTDSFYHGKAHLIYEGTHIIDLICWMLDAEPERLYLSGDPVKNSILVMEFPNESKASFMSGCMGSYLFWKEYIEIFSGTTALTVSDFTDMRVRGFPKEFDSIYPPLLTGQEAAFLQNGFDFYETVVAAAYSPKVRNWGMGFEDVRRPGLKLDASHCDEFIEGKDCIVPDKGWIQSLEHFAACFLAGVKPKNADGRAGARSTEIALTALESLRRGQPLPYRFQHSDHDEIKNRCKVDAAIPVLR